MKKNELSGLTGLRFFAAIHVVLFHNIAYLGTDLDTLPHFIRIIVSGGDHAVSLFFILSGFILTYNYQVDLERFRGSIKKFYFARFIRIYPLYFIAFLMDLPRGIAFFSEHYSKMAITSLTHLAMMQSWHPRLTSAWNFPGWSISTEFFFYLCFPFILPLLLKTTKNALIMMVLYLVPLFVFFVANNGFNLNLEQGIWATVFRSLPMIRLPEFALGIMIGKLYLKRSDFTVTRIHHLLFFISTTLSFLVLFIPVNLMASSFLAHLFLVPLFCLIIYLLPLISIKISILKNRTLSLLGNASYGMYITHMPLLFYFNLSHIKPGLPFFVSYLLVLIILSIFLFKFVEIPFQRFAKKPT